MVHHQNRYNKAKKMLNGWFAVPRRQCREIGQFPKPELAVFGAGVQEGTRREWEGTSSKALCVAQRRTYRVSQDQERCAPGEAAKQFAVINATSDSFVYTFRWNGPP
jgi:uncharacterized membrane protein